MEAMGRAARAAAAGAAHGAGRATQPAAIRAMAAAAARRAPTTILAANAEDVAAATAWSTGCCLDEDRLEAIAAALEQVAALPDPVGAGDGALAAPERARHRPRAHADRRHRHDLRKPAERHRRRRRDLPPLRQCGHPARAARKRCAAALAIHGAIAAGLEEAGLPGRMRPDRRRPPTATPSA